MEVTVPFISFWSFFYMFQVLYGHNRRSDGWKYWYTRMVNEVAIIYLSMGHV